MGLTGGELDFSWRLQKKKEKKKRELSFPRQSAGRQPGHFQGSTAGLLAAELSRGKCENKHVVPNQLTTAAWFPVGFHKAILAVRAGGKYYSVRHVITTEAID